VKKKEEEEEQYGTEKNMEFCFLINFKNTRLEMLIVIY
jgi:hypothetical protein